MAAEGCRAVGGTSAKEMKFQGFSSSCTSSHWVNNYAARVRPAGAQRRALRVPVAGSLAPRPTVYSCSLELTDRPSTSLRMLPHNRPDHWVDR